MSESRSDSYAAAGVDVTAGYKAVNLIKPMVESTYIEGVLGTIGGFGGLFDLSGSKTSSPVLVSGADGVGTKLRIAFVMDKHDTVGIDCVAMCVNDIACSGAAPLFFLDYLAVGKNKPERVAEIVSGVAEGCRQAGCALVGGETAEMPGFYPDEEYDLAGFSVGIVDRNKIIDSASVCVGDVLIGLSSSGLHSNGFSLVRRILGDSEAALKQYVPELGGVLGEKLLTPTKIYVKAIQKAMAATEGGIHGISHITGGGIFENVPRMLPEGLTATIRKGAIPLLPIFRLIAEKGNIPERDMYNTFNMGIGLVMAVDAGSAKAVVDALTEAGEDAHIIGICEKGERGVELC